MPQAEDMIHYHLKKMCFCAKTFYLILSGDTKVRVFQIMTRQLYHYPMSYSLFSNPESNAYYSCSCISKSQSFTYILISLKKEKVVCNGSSLYCLGTENCRPPRITGLATGFLACEQ
jgi:hypothetical protein